MLFGHNCPIVKLGFSYIALHLSMYLHFGSLQDPKDAMLREFQDEIARLKAKLSETKGGSGGGGGGGKGGGSLRTEYVEKIVEKEVNKLHLHVVS
jgi:hypothetical protein